MESAISCFFFFLPSLTAFVMTMQLLFCANKSKSQTFLNILAASMVCSYFVYGVYASNFHLVKDAAAVLILSEFSSLALNPFVLLFIFSLRGKNIPNYMVGIALFPSVLVSLLTAIPIMIAGYSDASLYIDWFYNRTVSEPPVSGPAFDAIAFIINWIYYGILFLGGIATTSLSVITLSRNKFRIRDIFVWRSNGHSSSSINVLCCSILLQQSIYVFQDFFAFDLIRRNLWMIIAVNLLTSLSLFLFIFIGTFFPGRKINWSTLRLYPRPAEEDRYLDISSRLDTNSLSYRFKVYILDERHFLDKDLTQEQVARAIGSNRTYISAMMKDEFKMNFRDYINNLRIEEAKRILRNSPDELLASVAQKSGFTSDAQLVRKFSESEGISPKVWLNSQL